MRRFAAGFIASDIFEQSHIEICRDFDCHDGHVHIGSCSLDVLPQWLREVYFL